MFQEAYIGSIRLGLRADLLVLDRDYLPVPPDEIKDICPLATIVDGNVVHGALNGPGRLREHGVSRAPRSRQTGCRAL
jgi:hypothetical protein